MKALNEHAARILHIDNAFVTLIVEVEIFMQIHIRDVSRRNLWCMSVKWATSCTREPIHFGLWKVRPGHCIIDATCIPSHVEMGDRLKAGSKPTLLNPLHLIASTSPAARQ